MHYNRMEGPRIIGHVHSLEELWNIPNPSECDMAILEIHEGNLRKMVWIKDRWYSYEGTSWDDIVKEDEERKHKIENEKKLAELHVMGIEA